MKIAVASDDGRTITGNVGRCELFIVYDINENEILNVEKRDNYFATHKCENYNYEHQQRELGETCNYERILNGLKDCKYLICSCSGPGLTTDKNKNGIEIILTDEVSAELSVQELLKGNLINNPNFSC